MTWTSKLWKFGETPDHTNMNNIQADITAKANGDVGAPENQTASFNDLAVDTDAFPATSIVQGKLSTSQGEVSGTPSAFGPISATLPGGEYGFYCKVKRSGGTDVDISIADQEYDGEFDDFIGTIKLNQYRTLVCFHSPVGSTTGYAQQRYVTSSPPYDLGDGYCHQFTFAMLDPSGNIVATYSAPEAPWHHNGPTHIQKDQRTPILVGEDFDHRGQYIEFRQILKQGPSHPSDFSKLRSWVARMRNLEWIEKYEDRPQSVKNADIDLIPHPFVNVPDDHTVVMLDPLSKTSEQVAWIQQREEESICELLHKGYFKISNSELSRIGPPGVPTVGYRWK
jgi:hypothetical protein